MAILLKTKVDIKVQDLAIRASSGDKRAQFELGERFEKGSGTPQDKAIAIQLYQKAAKDSGGTIWIYIPSPGDGASSRVVPFNLGPWQPGLSEAKEKIFLLKKIGKSTLKD